MRLADRAVALLFPVPLLVAEAGAGFAPELGSLPADIEGDGDDVEDLVPFVWIAGGMGRLTLDESACTVAADGAILQVSRAAFANVPDGYAIILFRRAAEIAGPYLTGNVYLAHPSNAIKRYAA